MRCGYDEGTCACVGYCGGAPPPPDTDFSHWSCTPNRTDGCPNEIPNDGNPCATDDKTCSYSDCCATNITCKGGTWGSRQLSCPP